MILEKFKLKNKVRWYTIKFFLGKLDEEVTIVTHNVINPMSDKLSVKVVKTRQDVVNYGRDIAQEGRHINGKLIEYVRTFSAFNWDDKFMFVVLYRNAS